MSSYKKNSTYSNVEFCLQAKKKKCQRKCQKVANVLKKSTSTLLFGMWTFFHLIWLLK